MIDLERRSTNALPFLIALVSARRKRVRDIDLRGKGSPLPPFLPRLPRENAAGYNRAGRHLHRKIAD